MAMALRAASRASFFIPWRKRTSARLFQAALALGLRVPSDVAVASLATFSVGELGAIPITTFGPPTIDVGRRAALRLLERIATPDLPERLIEVEGSLVVRASTVPA
jgi:DNA-binding LacI/PurR family transcriptional regulator